MRENQVARFNRLLNLSPVDAVRSYIRGAFGIGDETAILMAIRRDPRIAADDDRLLDVLGDAMEDESDPAVCLEQLASLK